MYQPASMAIAMIAVPFASEEIRQSLRIIEQCLENMPAGAHKADHPLTTPPLRKHTLQDIETLIDHFLGVSWGPVIPPGKHSWASKRPRETMAIT